MVVYKNILEKLKAAGYNTYRLRTEQLLSESVISRIRAGQPLSTDTLNKLCNILKCELSDIIEIQLDE